MEESKNGEHAELYQHLQQYLKRVDENPKQAVTFSDSKEERGKKPTKSPKWRPETEAAYGIAEDWNDTASEEGEAEPQKEQKFLFSASAGANAFVEGAVPKASSQPPPLDLRAIDVQLQGASGGATEESDDTAANGFHRTAEASLALSQEAYNAVEASIRSRSRSLRSPVPSQAPSQALSIDTDVEAANLSDWVGPAAGGALAGVKRDFRADFHYSSSVVEADEVFMRTLQAVAYPIGTLATQSKNDALAAVARMVRRVFQLFQKRATLPAAGDFTDSDYIIMLLRAARVVQRQYARVNGDPGPFYRKSRFKSEEHFTAWRDGELERLDNLLKQLKQRYHDAIVDVRREEDHRFDVQDEERKRRMEEVYGPLLERQLRGFCSRVCVFRRKKWEAQLTQSQRNLKKPVERTYTKHHPFPQPQDVSAYDSASDFEGDELWPSTNLAAEVHRRNAFASTGRGLVALNLLPRMHRLLSSAASLTPPESSGGGHDGSPAADSLADIPSPAVFSPAAAALGVPGQFLDIACGVSARGGPSHAPPRALLCLLVKALVQDANPYMTVPERGRGIRTGDVCDVMSQSAEIPAEDNRMRGSTHVLDHDITDSSVLREFLQRYQVSALMLYSTLLGVYTQNLTGALTECSGLAEAAQDKLRRHLMLVTKYATATRDAAATPCTRVEASRTKAIAMSAALILHVTVERYFVVFPDSATLKLPSQGSGEEDGFACLINALHSVHTLIAKLNNTPPQFHKLTTKLLRTALINRYKAERAAMQVKIDYTQALHAERNRARIIDASMGVEYMQEGEEEKKGDKEEEEEERTPSSASPDPAPALLKSDSDNADIVYSSLLLVVPSGLAHTMHLAAGATGVVFVDDVSEALHEAGLRHGDQIVKVNGSFVSADHLKSVESRLQRSDRPVELSVMRRMSRAAEKTLKMVQSIGTDAPPRYLELKLGRGVLDPSALPNARTPRLRVAVRLLSYTASPDPFSGLAEGALPPHLPAVAILDAAAASPAQGSGAEVAQRDIGVASPTDGALADGADAVLGVAGARHVISHASRVIGPAPNWQGQRLRLTLPQGLVAEIREFQAAAAGAQSPSRGVHVRYVTVVAEVWVEGAMAPLAVTLLPVPVWPPPRLHPAAEDNYQWVDLQAYDVQWAPRRGGAVAVEDNRLGQMQMAVGFVDVTKTKRAGPRPRAEPPLRLHKLCDLVLFVERQVARAQKGRLGVTLRKYLPHTMSHAMPALVCVVLYDRLKKDVLKYLTHKGVSSYRTPPEMFTLYNNLRHLHAALNGILLPKGFEFLDLDQLFEPHVPGWIELEKRRFLEVIVPNLLKKDDLKPVLFKRSEKHSISAQDMFLFCRSYLEQFKLLPRCSSPDNVSRFLQSLLCEPLSAFTQAHFREVSHVLEQQSSGRKAELSSFFELLDTKKTDFALLRACCVRMNNIHICRRQLFTVLSAINDLENVNVRSLTIRAKGLVLIDEDDSDASDGDGEHVLFGHDVASPLAASPNGPILSSQRRLRQPPAPQRQRFDESLLRGAAPAPSSLADPVASAAAAGASGIGDEELMQEAAQGLQRQWQQAAIDKTREHVELTRAQPLRQGGDSPKASPRAEIQELPLHRVDITVLSASALPRMDAGGMGRSDPYAVVRIASDVEDLCLGNAPRFSTDVIHRNLNPIWNRDFTHVAVMQEPVVHVQVYDYDGGEDDPDDFIGSISIPLRDFDKYGRVSVEAYLRRPVYPDRRKEKKEEMRYVPLVPTAKVANTTDDRINEIAAGALEQGLASAAETPHDSHPIRMTYNNLYDIVDTRKGDRLVGVSNEQWSALQATWPPRDVKRHYGKIKLQIQVTKTELGTWTDRVIQDRVESLCTMMARGLNKYLRVLLLQAVVGDSGSTERNLRAIQLHLDQVLGCLNKLLYSKIMSRIVVFVWEAISIELYNLLVPNLPYDNEVTAFPTPEGRKSYRVVTKGWFRQKRKYIYLDSVEVERVRNVYSFLKGFFVPIADIADRIAAPLPALLKRWERRVSDIVEEIVRLRSEAVKNNTRTEDWRSAEGLSYLHLAALLRSRADHGDKEAKHELKESGLWDLVDKAPASGNYR